MRILIKIAIILAILAMLIYGGLYGYAYYEVKKGVDETVQKVAPVAKVTYQDIYLSPNFDGTVGVDGIVIRPTMTNDEIRIQSIRLKLVGFMELIGIRGDIEKRELPEDMRLTLSGFSIDLNGQLLTMLSKMQKQAEESQGVKSQPSLVNFDALGCGDTHSIGIDELTRMGYLMFELDSDLEYHYDPLRNNLSFSLLARSKGMYAIDIKAEMKLNPNSIVQGKPEMPILSESKIEYVDAGYAALRNRFCASQIDSTEEVFKARHLVALSQVVGATFPEETVESYNQFLSVGGRISIAITPKPGVELATLGSYPLQDAIDLLGMTLAIDNKKVDFSKFEWGKSYENLQGGSGGAKKGKSVEAVPGPKVQMPAQFRTTSPSRLGNYVGSQVKIQTRSGFMREGVIESADGNSVTIRVLPKNGKGYISYPIPFSDISSAKVLY